MHKDLKGLHVESFVWQEKDLKNISQKWIFDAEFHIGDYYIAKSKPAARKKLIQDLCESKVSQLGFLRSFVF